MAFHRICFRWRTPAESPSRHVVSQSCAQQPAVLLPSLKTRNNSIATCARAVHCIARTTRPRSHLRYLHSPSDSTLATHWLLHDCGNQTCCNPPNCASTSHTGPPLARDDTANKVLLWNRLVHAESVAAAVRLLCVGTCYVVHSELANIKAAAQRLHAQ